MDPQYSYRSHPFSAAIEATCIHLTPLNTTSCPLVLTPCCISGHVGMGNSGTGWREIECPRKCSTGDIHPWLSPATNPREPAVVGRQCDQAIDVPRRQYVFEFRTPNSDGEVDQSEGRMTLASHCRNVFLTLLPASSLIVRFYQ